MAITSKEPGAYGGQMAKYFRLAKADSLVISPASKPPIAVTRLVSKVGLPERDRVDSVRESVRGFHPSDPGKRSWMRHLGG